MTASSSSIILASSSRYRKLQLQKFGIEFSCISPNIDESRHKSETPESLVKRLSLEKAMALQSQHSQSIIIGSDQVAYINESSNNTQLQDIAILTKPHTASNAKMQLRSCSGKSVRFVTGLCCIAPMHAPQIIAETVDVTFRDLLDIEIENYIELEKPFDCAGSFKVEGLGITLFSKVESHDPNTLIGLPLIALNKMLNNIGVNPLRG